MQREELCNMADFSELPVKNELKDPCSSFLSWISSQPTEYYRRKRIVLYGFCSGLNKET